MSVIEEYFFTSSDAERIEKVFHGAVLANENMELTAAEKEIARNNIGAGKEDRNFVIRGYFETMAELPPVPSPGEAYGIGYSEPYDIYVWDDVHKQWVDNGPIATASNLIDDNSNDYIHALSSSKVYDMLDDLEVNTTHIADGCVTASKIVDNSVSNKYTAYIEKVTSSSDISPWVATSGSAPYTQEIAINGILATDNPIIDVVASNTNYQTATDEINAWAEIYRIETLENGGGIRVYAHYPTQTRIKINLVCVRK